MTPCSVLPPATDLAIPCQCVQSISVQLGRQRVHWACSERVKLFTELSGWAQSRYIDLIATVCSTAFPEHATRTIRVLRILQHGMLVVLSVVVAQKGDSCR